MKAGDISERVKEASDTVPIVKARLVEASGGSESRVQDESERDKIFTEAGAIEPPYDFEMLALLFEHSNSLRQNVDAYAQNIDGFGHTLAPVINLDADDADDKVRAAIAVARGPNADDPSDDEVKQAKKEIARGMLHERVRLNAFFETCCDELSLVSLRRRTRQDIEVLGNGYWEVLRNRGGEIAEFVYVPGYTVRLRPLDPHPVDVKLKRVTPDFKFEEVDKRKKFRRYIQQVRESAVWFKEFGDPRLISCKSGKVFETPEAMEAAEPGSKPATEILHFAIHSPRSAYGVPRWIGNLLAVLGSRQAEEVNFLYFENKSVPPMAVLVSGGRISESSVKRIQDFIETHIKGKRNFHRILVLEAEPAIGTQSSETSARMKIELRPLLGAQHSDALFQKYDERNLDKVGQAFRLPRMLRGDIRDFNRSTALAAKHFAEEQVFQPEREDFDWIMNRRILSELRACYHRFRSLAPVTRDPQVMSASIKDLLNSGALVPEDGRELAGDVFNREFKRIDADWTKQPIQLTQSGYAETDDDDDDENRAAPSTPQRPMGKVAQAARELLSLREFLRKASRLADVDSFTNAHKLANADDEPEREVIRVPEATMREWFDDGASGRTDTD